MFRRTKTSVAENVASATAANPTAASPPAATATAATPIATSPELEAVKTEPVVYAAWIGLDWADEKHDWSLCTADGKRRQGQMKSTVSGGGMAVYRGRQKAAGPDEEYAGGH